MFWSIKNLCTISSISLVLWRLWFGENVARFWYTCFTGGSGIILAFIKASTVTSLTGLNLSDLQLFKFWTKSALYWERIYFCWRTCTSSDTQYMADLLETQSSLCIFCISTGIMISMIWFPTLSSKNDISWLFWYYPRVITIELKQSISWELALQFLDFKISVSFSDNWPTQFCKTERFELCITWSMQMAAPTCRQWFGV